MASLGLRQPRVSEVLVAAVFVAWASLVFAQLKHSGASPNEVVNTRALVSVAWVAGPPLATAIMGLFGIGAILLLLFACRAAGAVAERRSS